MKKYAKLSISLSPELKKYLSEEELSYEASGILREAIQKALVSLDPANLSDLPQDELTESFIVRTDLKTFLLVRSFRRPERKKFYSLVNEIAYSLVKEKLELKQRIKNKVAQLGNLNFMGEYNDGDTKN